LKGVRMKTVASLKLTQEGAMTILRGALDKARALGASASVAVVDDGGHLIAFGRSEEAELYSVAISQAKARSAALTRFPSGKKSPSGNERDDHHAIAVTLAAGPGSFVTIAGGFPIMVNGRCIGAVGASGAAKNDIAIAQAGVTAFEQS
jgi:glc operon protein GlcG